MARGFVCVLWRGAFQPAALCQRPDPLPVPVIRPTVARVDLEAIRSNFAAITALLASSSSTPAPRIIAVVKANAYGHGAPQVALALEEAGAAMLACADIEEGIVLREAGVRAPILVFGALSVSDLDGIFSHTLTPTISTPSAARGAAGRGSAATDDAALPPQDRHRHEPARVPPRQPGSHPAGNLREPEPGSRCRLHALRDRGRSGPPAFAGQRAASKPPARGSRRWACTSPRGTRPTARPCSATSASGTTSCGLGSCSTASCRRRSPPRCRCDPPCHSTAVSWR